MKRYLLYISAFLFAGSVATVAQAQRPSLDDITVRDLSSVSEGGKLSLSFNAGIDALRIGSQDLLIVVPELRANGTTGERYLLEPFFIAGKARATTLERERVLGNPREYMTPAPLSITVPSRGVRSVSYATSLPAQEWMSDASLHFKAYAFGCAACEKSESEKKVADKVLTAPEYRLSYVTPPVEDPKVREDKYTATIGFEVDGSRIDPSFSGNKSVLDEVNDKVVAILKNPDLKASKVEIVGYASPEASVAYNKSLSDKRAKAFADYLSGRYGVSREDFVARGEGEDWTRAEELIRGGEGNLSDEIRDKVLSIIGTVKDPDARDAEIKALDGGKTYSELLSSVWPAIRRTEYTISYTVRPFDVNEAKVLLKKNPKLLSLNELYLVAKTYDPASEEYKEVFDIASRLFPEEPVALINGAAADLEVGSFARALKTLPALGDSPEALNNLGVARALSGDYEGAVETLEKAAGLGSAEARANLEEISKTRN